MKFLCIGDMHYKISNSEDTEQMEKEVFRVLDDLKPDACVIMGDSLDTHEKIHSKVLSRVVTFITLLAKKIKVYLLIGNHDRINTEDFMSNIHPFVGLNESRLPIRVVNSTLYEDDCAFVPYVSEGRFLEALDLPGKDKWRDVKCIFAHQEFYGCVMGPVKSVKGDKWDVKWPIVVSGHIHDYQIPQPNVIYCGTPIQHGFGDTTSKALMMVTTDEKKVTTYERVFINIKKKITVYTCVDDIMREDLKIDDNVSTRIVITDVSHKLRGLIKCKYLKELSKNRNVKIVYKEVVSEENDQNPKKITTSIRYMNFLDALKEEIKESQKLGGIFKEVFG